MGARSVASLNSRRVTTFLLVDPWPLRDEEAPPITGNMGGLQSFSGSAYVPIWAGVSRRSICAGVVRLVS